MRALAYIYTSYTYIFVDGAINFWEKMKAKYNLILLFYSSFLAYYLDQSYERAIKNNKFLQKRNLALIDEIITNIKTLKKKI